MSNDYRRSSTGTAQGEYPLSSPGAVLVTFPLLMSTTLTRVLIVLGATIGPTVSVFVALVKLVPERAKLILGYQVEAITALQTENKRQAEIIARLEERVAELETNS